MPQRSTLLNTSSPFGNSLFASNWLTGRDRTGTLQSIRSSDGPSSPREFTADNDVRTLDYLGLVDSPQSGRGNLSRSDMDMLMGQQRQNGGQGVTIADLAALNAFNNKNTANRFRSYSVNAKEKYADADEEELGQYDQPLHGYSGNITPTAESTAAQAAAIHEAVRQHNLEVQAFANFASANRPRARTAGVLDSPSSHMLRNYLPTPSRLDSSMITGDLQISDTPDYNGLSNSIQNMKLTSQTAYEAGPEASLESPTRALWLGNVPPSTTVSSLNVIFSQFGPIEFARVLTHKSCGFVNFENVQNAIAAKAQCNGKEIFPGCGPIRIGFAKEQSASNTPGANGAHPSPSPDPFVSKSRIDSKTGSAVSHPNTSAHPETAAAAALSTPNLLDMREEIYDIVRQFGATPEDRQRIASLLDVAMSYNDYALEIPPIQEASHNRLYDAPRLREIRKRIDNNACSQMEIQSMALDMLPEIAELASDYLGNTVVQKLFEHCPEDTKEAMLAEIAPHLAEIGVHKNGTWAAQKIIDVARATNQMQMIVDALKPHGVSLFLDQYGNYVMQCCLRFQSPMNGFIFEIMLNKLWDVAQGRFGARAMRACLESHFATNDQKRLMAAAIALHSVQLATNSNGALLLTWFLDTCTFPQRRSVLAPRLIPHLVYLCTHKVAYLTVLKIINQRNEPEARDNILRALLFNDQTLTDIISDQACGANFIFKVLTTPFLDEDIRPECLENVRSVLLHLKAQPSQGYKRLMDEVGLSTRHSGNPSAHDNRSNSKSRQINDQQPHMDMSSAPGYGRSPYASMTPQHHMDQGMSPGLNRTISMDSNNYDHPYSGGVSQYTHSPAMSNAGMSPISQVQYQQAMLAQTQGQMPRPPASFYGGGLVGVPNGMPYSTGSPNPQMMDPLRQNMSPAQMMPPGMNMQAAYQQQGFGSPMMNVNGGYGQYQMPQYFPQGRPQGHMGGGQRRGRVRAT